MDNPRISVIIPVFNAEKYLALCIESILKQTFLDFELILVNDGSQDNSATICEQYVERDNRLKVVHKKNEGVSAARNAGIIETKGEFITFIDADDTIDETFLECAIRDIEQYNTDVYISGLKMEIWKNGKIDETIPYGIQRGTVFTTKELLENLEKSFPQICICGPCCKLYRRSIIMENRIRFETFLSYGEDTYFNLDVLRYCHTVYFSTAIFYHYRRDNAESLFSKFHRDTYEVHQMVYGKMRKLMREKQCEKVSMDRFDGLYFSLLVGGIHEYYKYYGDTTKKEKRKLIAKIARDSDVCKTTLCNVNGIKNKVIFILLKLKCNWLVSLIFTWKYCTFNR